MKKICSLVLTLCLLAMCFSSNVTFAARSRFSDLPTTHWASKYVSYMVDDGTVNGYNDGTFRPANNVSRAEWAKLFTQTAKVPQYKNYYKVMQNGCYDVEPNNWCAPYVVSALPYFDFDTITESNGKKTAIIEPTKAATRLEIVKSIIRERGYDLSSADTSLATKFKDSSKLSTEDKKYVALSVANGIINGFSDNTFRPNDNVTRAEACTILYRTYVESEKPAAPKAKPYRYSKLADGCIDEAIMATVDDNGNFYFIDSNDNCVYKVDLETRKKVVYFDASDLEFDGSDENGEKYFSSYLAKQVYYDTNSNSLILNGTYTSLEQSGKKPITDGKFTYMYDITNTRRVELFCVPDFPDTRGYWCNIQMILDDDTMFVGDTFQGYVDIETGKTKTTNLSYGRSSEVTLMAMSGNDLYYFAYSPSFQYCDGAVYKKDYSSNSFDRVSDIWFYDSFSVKDGAFYIKGYDIMKDDDNYHIYKIDLDRLMMEELDINFLPENVEFEDRIGAQGVTLGNFDSAANYFYTVDDSTFIFYDVDEEAFMILEKASAQSEPEVEITPYRVGNSFFEPYER